MSFIKSEIIKADASYAEYSRNDAKRGEPGFNMTRSELVAFSECPSKWLAGIPAQESTDAMNWGSLIDCLLTSPERLAKRFAERPETYTDAKGVEKDWHHASNTCKEWLKGQSGKIVVTKSELAEAQKAVKAIANNPVVAELFKVSAKQVFIVATWKDKDTGLTIPLRVLIDLVPPKTHADFGKWIADFKTARNGNPATWARVIDDQNYDWQAALYVDIYTAATGEDRTDFIHVVQENVSPYHVVSPLPAMTSEFLVWGRAKYQSALAKYAQCLKSGVWPSYEPAGTVYGNTQWIAPDDLWAYKQTAGRVGIGQMMRTPEIPTQETEYQKRTGDITP